MADERQSVFARVFGRLPREVDERSPMFALLQEKQVRVVYQPIVDLASHEVFGFEALARSLSPHYDGPVELFAAAVLERRVGELGRILRTMSVEGCPHRPLFLNVNPNEFDEGWLVQPDDPIFWHDHPVYMEITETVPLSHFALCKHVIGELRAKGVRLAIDDLGAGFSNLKYISDLEPDVVKVDRELVAGIRKGTRAFQLLESLVYLCRRMGAVVVAEGIETQEELDACCAAGVQLGQGFLLAYPNSPPPEPSWP